MKILLDTQAFIWLVNDDSRLGLAAKKKALLTKNKVFISYLSFFEMTIKASIGKLKFDVSIMEDLDKMGISLLAGNKQSLSVYRVFNEKNKDPFDNFLMATAIVNNLVLMSSDQAILSTKITGLKVIDVRK